MNSLLKKILPRKTVGGVLKVFNKTISDLERVQLENVEEEKTQRAAAAEALALAEEAARENAHAGVVITKLKAIVTSDVSIDVAKTV